MNFDHFLGAPEITGGEFDALSWAAWRAVMKSADALPLTPAERAIFAELAGGREPPAEPVQTLVIVAGRRGGKSRIVAARGCYTAALAEHLGLTAKLAPGETGVYAIIATDRKQAGVIRAYADGLLSASPALRAMVLRSTADAIELNNGTAIEVVTNSFRTTRGRTLIGGAYDECAFWRSEDSALPDLETHRAILPSLATTAGRLTIISSPYRKSGLLYDLYKRHFGQNSPHTLVIQAPSRTLNPTLPELVVQQALEDDEASALSEYLAQFRDDIAAFIGRAVVEAAVRPSPLELPFDAAHTYRAFTDPAGGGSDEYCLAIGHVARARGSSYPYLSGPELAGAGAERLVVDLLRARRGTPAAITAEYADLLKAYGLRSVIGDRYAGSWPADEFARHGITYEAAGKAKSDLYVDALAALNSGRVELPPDERLVIQFANLERRTARSGRDSVDHPPGGHDDRANVCAGLIALGAVDPGRRYTDSIMNNISGSDDGAAWRRLQLRQALFN